LDLAAHAWAGGDAGWASALSMAVKAIDTVKRNAIARAARLWDIERPADGEGENSPDDILFLC
jgi:hypothetical protein